MPLISHLLRIRTHPIAIALVTSLLLLPITTNAQNIISLDAGVLPGSPNIVAGGQDFVDGDEDPNDVTGFGHGDVVAKIIANQYSGAQTLSVKIAGAGFSSSQQIVDNGLFYAANQGARVVLKTTGSTGTLGAWQAVTNANKVAVVNSQNNGKAGPLGDGLYAPSLGGRMIVVGATDPNGGIAVYSNRAGDIADWYITAPGNNSFSSVQGTSFAAPHVGAVAAQILGQNSDLSAQQVVEIILSTADDLGSAGVDATYGHGGLNASRALDPILTRGGSSSGSSGSLAISALVVGGGIAYALLRNRRNESLENTFITDNYDRGYIFNLADRATVKGADTNLSRFLGHHQSHFFNTQQSANSYSWVNLSQSTLPTSSVLRKQFSAGYQDNIDDDLTSLLFFHRSPNLKTFQLSINQSLDSNLGAFSLLNQNEIKPAFLNAKILTSPYSGFTSTGIANLSRHQLTKKTAFSYGASSNQESSEYGLDSDRIMVQSDYQLDRFGVGMQMGSLREKGSLFGGASGGVLSVNQSDTLSLGVSSSFKINDRFSLLGSYSEGYTKVDDWSESYLRSFSALRSNAYGFGLTANGLLQKNDRFGFGYFRPLKVTNGSVNLVVPTGRADVGQPLSYNEERINLNPTANEHAFEAYYTFDAMKDLQLTTYLLHRKHPDHNLDANDENLIMTTFSYRY